MPITQDRMIATVNAGRDYAEALRRLLRFIVTQRHKVQNGEATLNEAFGAIQVMANEVSLLSDPTNSIGLLEMEYTYFKRMGKRNAAAAKWQEKKRRGQGTEPRAKSEPTGASRHTGIFLETKHRIANAQDDISFEEVTGMDVDEETRKAEEYLRNHPRPKPPGEGQG